MYFKAAEPGNQMGDSLFMLKVLNIATRFLNKVQSFLWSKALDVSRKQVYTSCSAQHSTLQCTSLHFTASMHMSVKR